MDKMKMAVIGKDVSKSLSPKMHNFIMKKLNREIEYDALSINPDEFDKEFMGLLERYDVFNVTIPYKLSVIPYLNSVRDDALFFGSVNLIDIKNKTGYNTDGYGFILMLENAGVEIEGKTILVLGSGGVGRAAIKKLMDKGAKVSAYDLNQDSLNNVYKEFPGFEKLEKIETKKYDIIINCTGVGMHRTEGISPVGKDLLSLCDTAVDLIYVPAKSEFLRIAEECGKKIVNGESMLFYQAYYADCIILGRKKDNEEAKAMFEEYRLL